MSYMLVPGTNQRVDVFGEGGGRRTAEAMSIPFLGELPLEPQIRIGGDTGRPVSLAGASDSRAQAFYAMAQNVADKIKAGAGSTGPRISIED
jgi:ATP-binding protein involved in chromosome partitioning